MTGGPGPGDFIAAAYVGATLQARGEQRRTELDAMLARTVGPVEEWPVELDLRVTEAGDGRGGGVPTAHLVCGQCRQSVWCLAKDLARGVAVWNLGQLRAAITLHYREAHTDGGGLPT